MNKTIIEDKMVCVKVKRYYGLKLSLIIQDAHKESDTKKLYTKALLNIIVKAKRYVWKNAPTTKS